jgi:hypothetical protein
MAPTGYVNLSVKPAASDAVTQLAIDFSACLGRKVSNTDAILIARQVIENLDAPSKRAEAIVLAAFELDLG